MWFSKSSQIQWHHRVKANNDNLSTAPFFFLNLLRPKPPKRSVGINTRPEGTKSLRQPTHTACGAHRGVVHRNSFALHTSSSVYQRGLLATPCILHVPAARHFGGTSPVENQERNSQSFILNLKVTWKMEWQRVNQSLTEFHQLGKLSKVFSLFGTRALANTS